MEIIGTLAKISGLVECVNVCFSGDSGDILQILGRKFVYDLINSTQKVLKKQMICYTAIKYFEAQPMRFLNCICPEPVGIKFTC